MSGSKWMSSVYEAEESCLVLPGGDVGDVVLSSTCSVSFAGLLLVLNPAKKLESIFSGPLMLGAVRGFTPFDDTCLVVTGVDSNMGLVWSFSMWPDAAGADWLRFPYWDACNKLI